MKRPKVYLEPREKYDPHMIYETDDSITYVGGFIVEMLQHDFSLLPDNKEKPKNELRLMALEFFEKNIEPLKNYYALEFIEIV